MIIDNWGKRLGVALAAAMLMLATGLAGAATYQARGSSPSHGYHQSSYQGMYAPSNASGASMVGDALLVRPASLAATVIGTGLFIVSLPIALVGNNVGEAAHKLVVTPARYTFKRPLGHFANDTNSRLP